MEYEVVVPLAGFESERTFVYERKIGRASCRERV